jgi:ubiquinone/menaquinone biosynthesis C-methylase UbiE
MELLKQVNSQLTQKMTRALTQNLTLGFSLARSAVFAGEQLTLPILERLLAGPKDTAPFLEKEQFRRAMTELYALLKKDGENIAEGLYPAEVLKTESPWGHWRRFPQILMDGYSLSKRRTGRKHADFSEEAQQYLDEVPAYYQRNYHFQTGGYLTKKSAELYEHQVEILFSGAADAMRRLILPMLKDEFPTDGEGLRFLEIGAGTGRLTKFMALTFPKARIVALDASSPYLQKARENLRDFPRVDFLQGLGEDLPFQNQSFDVVYSCFLFHELPFEVRRKVLHESHRVLKPGGFFGFVDSMQKRDAKDFAWALRRFPVDFHEPFFKNYIEHPMEDLLADAEFSAVASDLGFFSKAVLAKKP